MKRILLYFMVLMSVFSFEACTDDSMGTSAHRDQLFRPAFRKDDNTGKGSEDAYNCVITNLNSAHLYWYTVDDAVGYQVKWAVQNYVANGEQAWIDTENGVDGKSLLGSTIIKDPKQFDLLVENLPYQATIRFAIRALHSFDLNDPKNSEWYGYGDGRQWGDYMELPTEKRYDVPFVLQVSDITKNSMKVRINRSIADYTADQKDVFNEHFHITNDVAKIDYMTFTVSQSTPNATVNPTFVHYDIPESAWQDNVAEITVDGLSENSIYNIDVWDKDIPVEVDACYNSLMKRTKGNPGAPILIKHVETAVDTIGKGTSDETHYDISQYHSMKLDNIINNYMQDVVTAENQVFYLEGGKTYHFTDNPSLYKGMTLRTNPEDLAKGKRARLLMGGMMKQGNEVKTCNFMLGRQPYAGENATITLDIDSLRFMDLDVDCPLATNFGHKTENVANACGNYFVNMYSNGMGININLFEMNNCTFQGLIRGFFRIQGSNDFWIQHLKMIDCVTYNCGWYQQNGGGYNYFHADLGKRAATKSNILKDFQVVGNVFYNSPKGALLTDSGRNINFDSEWNIDIHNNTFVNFLTNANSAMINTKYCPGGSTYKVYNNLFINTKDNNDINRNMGSAGINIQTIQYGDGSGKVTFDFHANWTTNDKYKPWAANGFDATKNAPGAFISKFGDDAAKYFPHGKEELPLHVADFKATDLMVAPNPTHFVGDKSGILDFHTDTGIDGLYYKQTDQVKNSELYKKQIGAPRLFNGK